MLGGNSRLAGRTYSEEGERMTAPSFVPDPKPRCVCGATKYRRQLSCFECGDHGCSDCYIILEFGVDPETGYHDEEVLCGECANERKAKIDAAWEQKGDLERERL